MQKPGRNAYGSDVSVKRKIKIFVWDLAIKGVEGTPIEPAPTAER